MKTFLVFEDKGVSLYHKNSDNGLPVSNLLRNYSFIGNDIYFSCGSKFLINEIKECLKYKECRVLCFVDVVPDNMNTLYLFTQILKLFKKYNNVFIIPVICTEYVVLQSLYNLGLLKVNNRLKDLFNCLVVNKDFSGYYNSNMKNNFRSLEEAYKYLLRNLSLTCLHNNSNEGRFYREPCDSNCKMYSKCASTNNLNLNDMQYKAELILSDFPFFVVSSIHHGYILDNFGISHFPCDIHTFYKIHFDFYKKLFRSFDKRFNVSIPDKQSQPF